MLLTLQTGIETKTGHVGFVVDEVAPNRVCSEYFGLPYRCHPTNPVYSLTF